jgi:hypothetical protein
LDQEIHPMVRRSAPQLRTISLALIAFIISVLAFDTLAFAAQSGSEGPEGKANGIGVILGEPTGFTGKFWIEKDRAIDAGLAFSFNSFFLLYGDYLFHFRRAFGSSTEFLRDLVPYAGLGAELFFAENSTKGSGAYYTSTSGSSVGFGVRIPLGAEWMIPRAPLGIFVELVPGVGLIPGTFGFIQGGIGARFYF